MRKIFNIVVMAMLVSFYMGLMMTGVSGARTVDYNITATDPQGDVVAVNPSGTMVDDADILQVTSSFDGTNIVFTLTVKGTIYLSGSSTVYYSSYSFNMDTNDDGVNDWELSVILTPYGAHTTMTQHNGDIEYTSGITATGDGTSTITVSFPESYLYSGGVEVTSWAFNAGVTISTSDYSSEATDTAPDDGYYSSTTSGNSGGNDSGSSGNSSGNTSTSDNNTSGTQDTSIDINIIKPAENERIVVTSMYHTYVAEGTVSVPPGKTVDRVEWRITEFGGDWADADDNSTAGDWSSWTITLPVGTVIYMGITTDMTLHLEVRAILTNNDYNIATRTFVVGTSSTGGGGSGGTSGGSGGSGGGSGSGGTSEGSGGGSGSGGTGMQPTQGPDPATETPTDKTIKVSITTIDATYTDNGDTYSFSFTVQGTTGGVDHCKIAFIWYYTDGTHDTKAYWYSEGDLDDNQWMKMAGYTKFHFKPTSDDWKTWEFSIAGTFKKSTSSEDGEGKEAKFVRIYVRAYGDSGETKWNQVYKDYDFKTSSSGSNGGGSGDSGKSKSSTPGYDAFVLTMALVGAVAVATRRRYIS